VQTLYVGIQDGGTYNQELRPFLGVCGGGGGSGGILKKYCVLSPAGIIWVER
jgi:hypothetical protein